MRRRFSSPLLIALLVFGAVEVSSSSVDAQQRWAKQPDGEWHAVDERREPAPVFAPDSQLRLFGVTLMGGLPEGMASGIAIHPATNLLHFDLALTSLLSFGVRASVTFDPFDWVLAPTLTVSGGYSAWAKIPSTSTHYQLYYASLQPGLELGRRSRFRFFLRAGYSHLWAATRSPAAFAGVQARSQPSVRIHLFPSLTLGATGYFGR